MFANIHVCPNCGLEVDEHAEHYKLNGGIGRQKCPLGTNACQIAIAVGAALRVHSKIVAEAMKG